MKLSPLDLRTAFKYPSLPPVTMQMLSAYATAIFSVYLSAGDVQFLTVVSLE